MMVIDVRRAFFYAPMKREVYIVLPPEEIVPGECEVGLLHRALYGTRDALQCWSQEVGRFMGE